MSEVETIRYADLVFNLDFYPRREVDADRVRHLRDVLEAGGSLPPIIVDQKDRVVDGFHRARAHFGLYGAHAEIPCEFRNYESDGAMLLDAISRNAGHGKPLGEEDRQRCLSLVEKHGVSIEQLASAFTVTTARVTTLSKTIARPAQKAGLKARRGPSHVVTSSEPSRAAPVGPYGLAEINRVLGGLQTHEIDAGDPRILVSLKNLVRVAINEIKNQRDRGKAA